MANTNDMNTPTKVPCGGFVLGEGLALSKDGKTLNVTGGGSQADWNVTDSADSAFIKNKPFGREVGKLVDTWYYTEPTQNGQGQYVYTFTTTKHDWSLSSRDNMCKADITIDDVTYENVYGNVLEFSSGTTYNFITDGLPFNLQISRLNGSDPDTLTLTYDKDYFGSLSIFDKYMVWDKKLNLKTLDNSNAQNCMHLNYTQNGGTYEPSFDTYLQSSGGKIFKIVVDDSGSLSATQV